MYDRLGDSAGLGEDDGCGLGRLRRPAELH